MLAFNVFLVSGVRGAAHALRALHSTGPSGRRRLLSAAVTFSENTFLVETLSTVYQSKMLPRNGPVMYVQCRSM